MLLPRLLRFWNKKEIRPIGESAGTFIAKIIGNEPGHAVQIGSNDGVTHDPLHKLFLERSNWQVVLVEPIPAIFAQLKANYPNESRFSFEQLAVNDGKDATFYFIDPNDQYIQEQFPEWASMLGSFDRKHIEKHLDGALTPYIKEMSISSVTLAELLAKHKVEKLHLLHIDAEGYDWKILQQLDLDVYKPKVILFEYYHLSAEEITAAKAFLMPKYRMYLSEMDFVCVRK
jgi:FkbM family methyltransferase